MFATPDFVTQFAFCLGSPKWLPFESPQFVVEPPEMYEKQKAEHIKNGWPFDYSIKTPDGQHIGHIEICLSYGAADDSWFDPKCFWINGISTKNNKNGSIPSSLGYGRELVRRAVRFAEQKGCERVCTSIFSEDGGSFWPAMGFNSILPLEEKPYCKPNWKKVRGHIQEKAEWQQKLGDNPDTLWDLAQTAIGRRVLYNTGGIGLLDLQDTKQRTYAFKRLHLPDPRMPTPALPNAPLPNSSHVPPRPLEARAA